MQLVTVAMVAFCAFVTATGTGVLDCTWTTGVLAGACILVALVALLPPVVELWTAGT